jgi:Flp pilus assembly protein TadB
MRSLWRWLHGPGMFPPISRFWTIITVVGSLLYFLVWLGERPWHWVLVVVLVVMGVGLAVYGRSSRNEWLRVRKKIETGEVDIIRPRAGTTINPVP